MSAPRERTVRDRLEAALGDTTPTERRVLRHLLADHPVAGLATVAEIGKRSGTSGPTVVRLMKRVGFGSHGAFQEALRTEVRELLRDGERERAETRRASAHVALADAVDATLQDLHGNGFADLVAALADRRRRVVCGGGRISGSLAVYLASHLRLLRPNVHVLDPGPAAATGIVDLRANDIVVLYDFHPHEPSVGHHARAVKARRALLVIVTDPHLSPGVDHADHTVITQVTGLHGFESLAPAMAATEALIVAVEKRLGSTVRDRVAAIESLREVP